MNNDVIFQDILKHTFNTLTWLINEVDSLIIKKTPTSPTSSILISNVQNKQLKSISTQTEIHTKTTHFQQNPFQDLINILYNIQKILFILSNDALTPIQRHYKNNEFILQKIRLIQLSKNTIFENSISNNLNILPQNASDSIQILHNIQSITDNIIHFSKDYKSNHLHQMKYPSASDNYSQSFHSNS